VARGSAGETVPQGGTDMTVIAVLGFGEAGRLYAQGLSAAGATVRAYDPYVDAADPRFARLSDLAGAVTDAAAVLSLVGARSAVAVAGETAPLLRPGAVYADLNTAAPEVKRAVAAGAAGSDVRIADVAVLAPVPRAGHRTPLIASGPGASAFAALLEPFGAPVEVVPGDVGEAARLKLLRSVFMKGLATLLIESLGAARAQGSEEWLREQMARELGSEGAALVDRLVTGTYEHAARREHEVRDALAALEASGQPADMTRATLAWFERIVAERA
jgi:3-hydroxyisobutyrate dehydrogenase-like beta-hydroxyacid dehydrogenase